MPKLRDVLTKVCDLCKARGFVFERSFNLAEGNSTALDYGPLGIEIKRSLFNEWWHEIVISRENVSGIELGWPYSYRQSIVRETDSTPFNKYKHLSDYLSNVYQYACDLMEIHGKDDGTAGLAQSLTVLQNGNGDDDKFMFRSQKKEFYKLCFFCPPNKVNYWMDFWMRKRLSWWKKYADIPAEFSLVEKDCRKQFLQEPNDALSDTMVVQFNFPWGEEAIECISSYTDVRRLIKNGSHQNEYLGLVLATVSVERGILAYLLDAYNENEYVDTKGVQATHRKLRLHPALAPVKVAVFSHNALNTDSGRVARQLANELRQAGVTCQYLEVEKSCDEPDTYIWQQDEIGTPYTVTVLDSTLTNGIVTLRNRDTTISEFLHISEILKTVQRHLDAF